MTAQGADDLGLPIADRPLVGEPFVVLRETLRNARGGDGDTGLVGVRSTNRSGRGQWDFFDVAEHLTLSIADATYDYDTWIEVPGEHQFKIRVLISGELLDRNRASLLTGPGAYLAAYPGDSGEGYFAKAGTRLRLLVLHCRPGLLTEDLKLPLAAIPEPLARMFDSGDERPVGANIRLGSEVLRAANDLIGFALHFPHALRRAYFETRGHEIVLSVLKQLSAPDFAIPEGAKLTMRDISRVHEARDLLADRYAQPPSIAQLARIVGLNQTKLKSAFKLVFGMTAYDFVRKCRMESAAEMLATSEMTIAEIAYAVGFEYPANFTHAFHRYFGALPSERKGKR